MMRVVVTRLAWAVAVVAFVVSATFLLVTQVPADPARTLLGPHASPDALVRVRIAYCLDRGFAAQYACYVGRITRGDLGESFRTRRPVREVIADRVGPTAQLALAALVLQLGLGIPLGAWAAARRGRWPDRGVEVVTLLGQSAPPFVVGTVLLYVLAYLAGWFPLGGYGEGGLDRLHHLVLPAATLATTGVAYYARLVRTEIVDQLASDHVRTARAKGLPERDVVLRHALRGALGPVVALAGIDLGVLLGGTVVTEYIFAWPGLGRELVQAILEVDLPLMLGIVLVSAIFVAVASLLGDIVAATLDPRLRDGS